MEIIALGAKELLQEEREAIDCRRRHPLPRVGALAAQFLRSACLVSRIWRQIAQPLLHDHAIVTKDGVDGFIAQAVRSRRPTRTVRLGHGVAGNGTCFCTLDRVIKAVGTTIEEVEFVGVGKPTIDASCVMKHSALRSRGPEYGELTATAEFHHVRVSNQNRLHLFHLLRVLNSTPPARLTIQESLPPELGDPRLQRGDWTELTLLTRYISSVTRLDVDTVSPITSFYICRALSGLAPVTLLLAGLLPPYPLESCRLNFSSQRALLQVEEELRELPWNWSPFPNVRHVALQLALFAMGGESSVFPPTATSVEILYDSEVGFVYAQKDALKRLAKELAGSKVIKHAVVAEFWRCDEVEKACVDAKISLEWAADGYKWVPGDV